MSQGTLVSINLSKGYEILGEVKISSEKDILSKVHAARKAQKGWQALALGERLERLGFLLELIKENQSEFARRTSLEMGQSITLSTMETKRAIELFEWDLAHAPEILKDEITFENEAEVNKIVLEPLGVGAVIVAWNFPLPNFMYSVVQAVIAGNTVVMKYSEEIPLFSKFLEELCHKAGLEDIIHFIYGDGSVGGMLVDQDIDYISFTGSYATGAQLYKKAAQKFIPVTLELGGSSPGIVFADADLDEIVGRIYGLRFINCGQFCSDLKRLIVHHSIKDALTDKLVARAKQAIVGDPLSPDTDMGPLVAQRQVEKLAEQVRDALDKGARLLCGGKKPVALEGAYFEPTLLSDISRDMLVWKEEVFGPVLPIIGFDTYEEAIELANDTPYGLTGYVFTRDNLLAIKAMSDIKAGTLSVNTCSASKAQNPFGGYKHSGVGRQKGKYGYREVTQAKVMAWQK
ncbi:MAG: aldehyde dehydrogenase family protein [Alphaproteobacteria bacterium]